MKNSDMLFTTMKGKFVETIYEEAGLYTTRELKGVDYSTLLDYAAEKDLRIQNRQNPKMQQEIRKEEMAQKVAVYHDREGRITIVDKALPKKAVEEFKVGDHVYVMTGDDEFGNEPGVVTSMKDPSWIGVTFDRKDPDGTAYMRFYHAEELKKIAEKKASTMRYKKKADGIMNTKQGDPKMNELAWKLFDKAGDLLNKIYTTPGVEDKMRTEALDVNLAMQEMVSYFDR